MAFESSYLPIKLEDRKQKVENKKWKIEKISRNYPFIKTVQIVHCFPKTEKASIFKI